jgi:hypothetical protein
VNAEDDWVLRAVARLGAALAAVLAGARRDDPQADAIAHEAEGIAGIDVSTARRFSAASLVSMMRSGDRLGEERLAALAIALEARGDGERARALRAAIDRRG